jgi:hypothetical protein
MKRIIMGIWKKIIRLISSILKNEFMFIMKAAAPRMIYG